MTHGGHLLETTVFNEGGTALGNVDKIALDDDLTISSDHASGFLRQGSKLDVRPGESFQLAKRLLCAA